MRVPNPIIYESTLSESRRPLNFGDIIDLMHLHRGYVAKTLGFDLIAVARDPGLAFYLVQLEIRPTAELSSFVGVVRAKSWVSDYSNHRQISTRVVVNFEFSTPDGSRLVTGRALYATINAHTGKLTVFPDRMWQFFVKDGFVLEAQSESKVKLFDLKVGGDSEYSYDDLVKPDDIDFYNHVGSGAYLRYSEQLIRRFGRDINAIQELDVQFLNSLTTVGAKFTGRIGYDGENAVKFLFVKDDGTPILIGRAVSK